MVQPAPTPNRFLTTVFIGLSIRIKNIPFQIIGVLKNKVESSMGQDQDNLILAPYTTVQRRLAAIDYINGIYALAVSERLQILILLTL